MIIMSKSMRDALKDALFILLGEIAVCAVVSVVFLILSVFEIAKFDHTVILGGLLGSLVVVVNYFILAVTVNRAIDKYVALRGDGEMTEEEAEKFAAENSKSVSMAAGGTYILRMLLMIGVLVGAFLLQGVFNVIATVIPLIAYRPIIYVIELIRSKKAKKEVE